MVIQNAGNVGIGTTSPRAALDVRGDDGAQLIVGNSAQAPYIKMWSGANYGVIDMFNATGGAGSRAFQIQANATTPLLSITNDARTGIGEFAPGSGLGVRGNASIGGSPGYYSQLAAPTNGLIVAGNTGSGLLLPPRASR